MAWKIEFTDTAKNDLSRLDKVAGKRVIKFLFQRLSPTKDPRSLGLAMKSKEFENIWRYRVGDYRLLCSIRDKIVVVLVLRIRHRGEVYK